MNPMLEYVIRGISLETGHPVDAVFLVWEQQDGYDATVRALHAMYAQTMRMELGINERGS